jgi:hypothetical protein
LLITTAFSYVDIRVSSLVQAWDFQTDGNRFLSHEDLFFLSIHFYFIAFISVLLLFLYIIPIGKHVPHCCLKTPGLLPGVIFWCMTNVAGSLVCDPETLVIYQKITPVNNPEDFKQHYDHSGSLQLHICTLLRKTDYKNTVDYFFVYI